MKIVLRVVTFATFLCAAVLGLVCIPLEIAGVIAASSAADLVACLVLQALFVAAFIGQGLFARMLIRNIGAVGRG